MLPATAYYDDKKAQETFDLNALNAYGCKPKNQQDKDQHATLYQERAVYGKIKMDPAKRAQTQNTGEVSSLEWSFPNLLN